MASVSQGGAALSLNVILLGGAVGVTWPGGVGAGVDTRQWFTSLDLGEQGNKQSKNSFPSPRCQSLRLLY